MVEVSIQRTLHNILKYMGHRSLQTHILNRSGDLYEDVGSSFFGTITGIQSGPDTLNESGSVTTFTISQRSIIVAD